MILTRTVVANGQFPGPLISANEGDNFQINVTDSLTDTSMYRATSIVSGSFYDTEAYNSLFK